MSKNEAINSFAGGLVSDLNAIATPPSVLTDALNATLLTFNGNELVLQNDMGNTDLTDGGGKVQLTTGFIPIGVKEHGGIIYIISNNPTTKETEIGSFPSPAIVQDEPLALTTTINLNDTGSTLNKNFMISEKTLNSGDSFIIFLKSDDISSYISSLTSRKFYKIKLISIENGIELDITNTLSSQYKLVGNTFVDQHYWFVPLTISESAADGETLQQYVTTQNIQRYKARKRGKLALKVIPETIDEFYINNTTGFPTLQLTNSNNLYDGNIYLKFNFYIKALSLIKADTIKIKITLINLDGESADEDVSPTDITFTMSSDIKDDITKYISIGTSYNKIASYTIECWNSNYGIHFNEFDITDLINLSIAPANWANSASADYNFYDYYLHDYYTI